MDDDYDFVDALDYDHDCDCDFELDYKAFCYYKYS